MGNLRVHPSGMIGRLPGLSLFESRGNMVPHPQLRRNQVVESLGGQLRESFQQAAVLVCWVDVPHPGEVLLKEGSPVQGVAATLSGPPSHAERIPATGFPNPVPDVRKFRRSYDRL